MNPSIFCFGELLLRMSPVLNRQWIRQASVPVYVGGAELNAATALAGWNHPVKYCTALPANYLADEILTEVRDKGIDVSAVHRSGNRIGIYYLPQGADLKNAGVIYDRAHSSFSELKPGTIDWHQHLQNCSWFHFSAISPALNENLAEVCKEALQAAADLRLTISVDLNYRNKLWQYGMDPIQVMPDLVQYCDGIMGNIWAASSLLGIPVDEDIHRRAAKSDYLEHAAKTAKLIKEQYPACKWVANTYRFEHAGTLQYYATLNADEAQYVSPEFATSTVVDKVGSGDCFMAGLIHGFTNGESGQSIIDFAAAAAFGKLSETGDATSQSIQQVNQTIASHA